MLDELGLAKRDAQGVRLMANGKPLMIEINVVPAFGAWPDVGQLVARDWEAVGVKAVSANSRARAGFQHACRQ